MPTRLPAFVDNLEVGAWIDIKRVILPIVYIRAHMVIEKGIHIVPFRIEKEQVHTCWKGWPLFHKRMGPGDLFQF